MMKNQMFTGIGCFAKPDRLERIFNRIVRNYTLEPRGEYELLMENLPKNNEGAHLLQALMANLAESGYPNGTGAVDLTRPREIAGFYLTLSDQKLNLSIFARGNNSRSEIFQTSLGDLTRLRHKRLN